MCARCCRCRRPHAETMMTKLLKQLLLAAGLAALTMGVAHAEGDGGDNSMSQWTGESYAAFYGNNVGDFYTEQEKRAQRDYPAAEPAVEALASTGRDKHQI